MFVFQVRQALGDDMVNKALSTMSFDELIVYLAGCQNIEEAFNFLNKFDFKYNIRSFNRPDVVITTVLSSSKDTYNGYSEYSKYFVGMYKGEEITGVLTQHIHENGCVEWFFSYYPTMM